MLRASEERGRRFTCVPQGLNNLPANVEAVAKAGIRRRTNAVGFAGDISPGRTVE